MRYTCQNLQAFAALSYEIDLRRPLGVFGKNIKTQLLAVWPLGSGGSDFEGNSIVIVIVIV
jgi:hypothetical protein